MLDHLNSVAANPPRVVVIGAGGFVGGAILTRLAQAGANVVGLSRKQVDLLAENGAASLLDHLREGDTVVFVSAVAPARNSHQLIQNLQMAEAACKAMSQKRPAHLIYVSSDAVYADEANPVTERSVLQPSSFHGMMHAARELMFKAQVPVPLAILRPTLIYGARDPHNGYGPNRFRRQAAEGKDVGLFGEGEEQRDHVFIDDLAEITRLAIVHKSRGILNVATGTSTSFRAAAKLAVVISGNNSAIKGSPRQNPISHRHFDIVDSLKSFPAFNYVPLREGMQRAVQAEAS